MNTDLFGNKIEADKPANSARQFEQLVSPLSQTFNEDCMVVMARYPDKYFDLAVVDPPYGLGKKVTSGGSVSPFIKQQHSKVHIWDNVPSKEYFLELMRISQNQIIWGGNYFELPPCRCFIIWDKTIHGNTYSDCEFAWTSFDKPSRIYKENICVTTGDGRIHPTQKSIAIYAWVFDRYAERGQKILDTHLGSGSSRIAAYKAGLDFTGCELDKDYFEAQEARFKIFVSQQTLF